uniref:Uncharacterized protein n=1 Tax=Chenopodium quinoa TaxID=63459 RepID=A0A803LYW8_CHEQI
MGLKGIDEEINLLVYILSEATVLDELCVSVRNKGETKEAQVWNAYSFSNLLFMLPRVSSTCEIVFSDGHMRASSKFDKNGNLTLDIIQCNFE